MEWGDQRLPQRFWDKVRVTEDGCWEWIGCVHRTGYGHFKVGRRAHGAHKVAYEALVTPLPTGMVPDHTCHDPERCAGGPSCRHRRCVNPAHMKARTGADNTRRGCSANRSTCRSGRHPWVPGTVTCQPCESERKAQWRQENLNGRYAPCPTCGEQRSVKHMARHLLTHSVVSR